MRLFNVLMFAIVTVSCAYADAPMSVDWSSSSEVPADERSQLLNQLYTATKAAGYTISTNATIKAEFMAERDNEPFQEVFFTLQGPTGKLWVRCLYPVRTWLKLYRDWDAVNSAEKYGETFIKKLTNARNEHPAMPYTELLSTLVNHPRQEAETRARSLADSVGGVDLTGWQCVSWSFDAGQWVFHFQPFFKGHRLKIDSVSMRLSDIDGLRLCEYHNTMLAPVPRYKRVPDVIIQAKARELADKYVAEHYKRQQVEESGVPKMFRGKRHNEASQDSSTHRAKRVPDLVFVTNTLEVVRPNYFFTEKYDQTGKWLKNPPRWSWTAEYTKALSTNFFTFSKTPVWIYVDAETGDMLGGAE